jgi:hypothetical protein
VFACPRPERIELPASGSDGALLDVIDAGQHFTAAPDELVYKEAPTTLYGADGQNVTSW